MSEQLRTRGLGQSVGERRQQKVQQLVVFWAIWATMFASMFVYQVVLGEGLGFILLTGPVALSAIPAIAWIAAAVCIVVRLVVLPRVKTLTRALPVMIFGVAMAESLVFYQLFLMPVEAQGARSLVFVTAVALMLTYMPLFGHRLPVRRGPRSGVR